MEEKKFYLEAIKNISEVREDELENSFYEFMNLQHVYDSAAEIVKTNLNIYDNEFQMKFQRSPIHNIESRIKSPQSILEKLQKKGLPVTIRSAKQNLFDIAGIRVTCFYISDVYAVAELLMLHDEFKLLKVKDYIKAPKKSGYRSLHMIINVPVYTSNKKEMVPVEIQIRTIAMDFWASLEHQLKYKTTANVPDDLKAELASIAETISDTDLKMQQIFNKINNLE